MTEQIRAWPVVCYRGARDPQSHPETWDPAEMVERLGVPHLWDRPKIEIPAWSPVEMVEPGARRAAANVRAVSMLVLDCDSGEPIERLESLGDEYMRIGHTSWSHTPGHPKARIVFPFARPCPVAHWGRVWGAASRWAASHGVTVDAAAKDPSRLYFGPFVQCAATFTAWGYDDDPPGAAPVEGALPPRRRSLMCWASLVSAWPEPPRERVTVRITAGAGTASAEQHDKRRRAFGNGLILYRARQLSTTGEGGRNCRLFGAARLAAQLVSAGACDVSIALESLTQAGAACGLSAAEVSRTIRSGYSAGTADPPYDIKTEMG